MSRIIQVPFVDDPLLAEAVRQWALRVTQPDPEVHRYQPVPRRPVDRVEQNRQIVELFDLGYSRTEIAKRLHMNRETVSQRLKRLAAQGQVSA